MFKVLKNVYDVPIKKMPFLLYHIKIPLFHIGNTYTYPAPKRTYFIFPLYTQKHTSLKDGVSLSLLHLSFLSISPLYTDFKIHK